MVIWRSFGPYQEVDCEAFELRHLIGMECPINCGGGFVGLW